MSPKSTRWLSGEVKTDALEETSGRCGEEAAGRGCSQGSTGHVPVDKRLRK